MNYTRWSPEVSCAACVSNGDLLPLLAARVANAPGSACGITAPPCRSGTSPVLRLFARKVEVFDGPKQVATHERAIGNCVEVLTLDHDLEVLTTKPDGLVGGGWHSVAMVEVGGVPVVDLSRYAVAFDPALRARESSIAFWENDIGSVASMYVSEALPVLGCARADTAANPASCSEAAPRSWRSS